MVPCPTRAAALDARDRVPQWRSPDKYAQQVAAFRKGLAEAGYIEGQNVAIEYGWAEGQLSRLPALGGLLVPLLLNIGDRSASLCSPASAEPPSSRRRYRSTGSALAKISCQRGAHEKQPQPPSASTPKPVASVKRERRSSGPVGIGLLLMECPAHFDRVRQFRSGR
jgi:hypothetical protein